MSVNDENDVQTLLKRVKELEETISQQAVQLNEQKKKIESSKPISVDVHCKNMTRTVMVARSDKLEDIQGSIKSAFNLTTMPTLYLGEKQITEEYWASAPLFTSNVPKLIKCEIFSPWDVAGSEESGIDYDKLVTQFGLKHIDHELIERFERLTGMPAHPWLRRGFFYCHRGFDLILDHLEQGNIIYLYTGRGPSSTSLHLGHMIQFMFAKYLQDAFKCVLVIQMSNDEKFIFKKELSIEDVEHMTFENTKDVMACGFDPSRTFIFSDLDYIGAMYRPVLRLLKNTTAHTESKIYGFDGSSPAGFYTWPSIQAAPSFSCSFPHLFGPPYTDTTTGAAIGPCKPWNRKLKRKEEPKKEEEKEEKKAIETKEAAPKEEGGKVQKQKSASSSSSKGKGKGKSNESQWAVQCLIPCAIDQDPYFRMSLDLASSLGFPAPCTLYSRFVPDLSGGATKMSASAQLGASASNSDSASSSSTPSGKAAAAQGTPKTIFMSDTPKSIARAVNSGFSIGADTKKDQAENGAKIKDLKRDAAFSYLEIFDLETPDEELAELGRKYLAGAEGDPDESHLVMSGTIKQRLIKVLCDLAAKHQERRKAITDEQVRAMMRLRPLDIKRLIEEKAKEAQMEKEKECEKKDEAEKETEKKE